MSSEPLVRLKGVRKSFGTGELEQRVLRDLSFDLKGGDFVALIGPSGCGKTTLLNLIGGLDSPTAGSVHVNGIDISGASRAELTRYRAESVGFVFQFYNLLPTLTAVENVEAGLLVKENSKRSAHDLAIEYLSRVGLADSSKKFPAQLSGGEQQRVAVARALAKEPLLMLADEPTGNLDEDTAKEVMQLMKDLNHETGATFIIVSHNPMISESARRSLHLSEGRIVEKAS